MVEVALTNGGAALVDDTDFPQVQAYQWYGLKIGDKTYVTAYVDGKSTLLQRFLVPTASGHNIRFKNGNTLDCRRENLEPTRHRSSRTNFKRTNQRTSKYEGVSYHKGTGKYISRTYREGKQIWLGSYDTEVEAFAINRAYHEPPFTDAMIAQRTLDYPRFRTRYD